MIGFVIVRQDSGLFYNGMGQWKKDIRDAKIYHTERGASETANYRFIPSGICIEIKPININFI